MIGDSTEIYMTPRSVRNLREQEDPLALLTATVPVKYECGAILYSEFKRAGHLHLIIRGTVKVSRRAADRSIVVDVYGPEEFFGECALLNLERPPEEAVALESTEVMRWTKREIEQLVLDRPLLGVALMQTLARRTIDLGARLQDCLGEKSAGRLLRSLIRFSERSGAAMDALWVHLMPITHQQLAEYTGTSRETVAHYMKEFRRQGLLHYSHQGIVLTQRAFQVAERGAYFAAGLNNVALDGKAA